MLCRRLIFSRGSLQLLERGRIRRCDAKHLPVIMTSLSPGDGVSYGPNSSPSSSSRHQHSNDPSFVAPSHSLIPTSLTFLLQRLVDLLILTSPTSSAHRHLTTALDHAITAATRFATHSSLTPSHQVTSLPSLPLSLLPSPTANVRSPFDSSLPSSLSPFLSLDLVAVSGERCEEDSCQAAELCFICRVVLSHHSALECCGGEEEKLGISVHLTIHPIHHSLHSLHSSSYLLALYTVPSLLCL